MLFPLPGRLPDSVTVRGRVLTRSSGPDAWLTAMPEDVMVHGVDGGSMLLGRQGVERVGLIRIATVTYRVQGGGLRLGDIRIDEWRVRLTPREDEDGLVFHARAVSRGGETREELLRPPRAVADDETALSILRSMLEKEAASRLDGLILLDGMLEARYTEEEAGIRRAREHGVIGIVKDPLIPAVEGDVLGILHAWWEQPWLVRLDGFHLARLHEKARFSVRLDNLREEKARLIAWLARDASLPGYPYPLIMADMHARISLHEADLARGRILIEHGSLPMGDPHGFLDTLRY